MITETTHIGNVKNLKLSYCEDNKKSNDKDLIIEAHFELCDQTEHGPYVKETLYTLGRGDTIEDAVHHLIQSTVGSILEYHNEQIISKKEEDPCTFESINKDSQ